MMCTRFTICSLVVVGGALVSCGDQEPDTSPEVTVVRRESLPDRPDASAWEGAPVHLAPLIPQDMVEPRQLEPTTSLVAVQAITDGNRLAFRLAWGDETRDDRPAPARFADACAVQLPSRPGPDLPAPQMGEPGRTVEIVYWSAVWQAVVDGREDDIKALYPGAQVDHYPFEAASLDPETEEAKAMADRYAPARALKNPMARPTGDNPVQDLIAEGPGTLSPASRTDSRGWGHRTDEGWEVVLSRSVPAIPEGTARTQVAFAVWDGARQEVGARKMRSVWIPLAIEDRR